MFKERLISGYYDAIPLPKTSSDKTGHKFTSDTIVASMVAGSLVSVKDDGTVQLCTGDTSTALGVVTRDMADGHFDSSSETGLVSILCQGSVIETDQVADNTIKPGDKLYAVAGKFGKTVKGDVVGIARTANSSSDLSLVITVKI